MSIRIIDPADRVSPYLSQCVEVLPNVKEDMCALRRVVLEQTPIPIRDLEVQVALFPESMIRMDPSTGEPICPAGTEYDAVNGFPIASQDAPAVGGRAFYQPNDEFVLVPLACANLDLVSGCDGPGAVEISAQVNDFDSRVTFNGPMTVSVGEPVPAAEFYTLPTSRLQTLEPAPGQTWAGGVDDPFMGFACLAVLDDAPQSTTTLVCREATAADTLVTWPNPSDAALGKRASAGVRLSKAALDQLLAALSMPSFPEHGLTIGLVLDRNGDAVPNQMVTATAPMGSTRPPPTVQYFSFDRSMVGGTRTTGSGVWASTDAEFGTTFTATSGVGLPVSRIGGQIDGRVTIVVLQFGIGTGG
ncbi:MAG: hypothetical protein H0T46_30065 [Deltaproteobacteria bacterium]|nr:hypothetical protein [Deltaproteobacteria bacterium]